MSDFEEVTLNCYQCGNPIACLRKPFLLGPEVSMSRRIAIDAGDDFEATVDLKGSKPCCEACAKDKLMGVFQTMLKKEFDFQEDND